MANVLNTEAVTFMPAEYPELFVKTLQKSNFLNEGYLTIVPGITKDLSLTGFVGLDSLLRADNRDCAWDPTTAQKIANSVLTLKNFVGQVEQCKDALDAIYSREMFRNPNQGANKEELPNKLESVMFEDLLRALGVDITKIIIGGAGNNIDGSVGIVDIATASDETIKVEGADVDSTNVIKLIESTYEAIPDSVLMAEYYAPVDGKVNMFVSVPAYRALKTALGKVGTKQNILLPAFSVDGDKIFYQGVEIVPVGVLERNTILAFSAGNVVFGTDFLSDLTEVRVWNGYGKDKNMWYAEAQLRAGVTIVNPDEFVICSKA